MQRFEDLGGAFDPRARLNDPSPWISEGSQVQRKEADDREEAAVQSVMTADRNGHDVISIEFGIESGRVR